MSNHVNFALEKLKMGVATFRLNQIKTLPNNKTKLKIIEPVIVESISHNHNLTKLLSAKLCVRIMTIKVHPCVCLLPS